MLALEQAVRFATVCSLDDLPVGLGRGFVVGGRRVAVFRTRGGKVFAVANECPHRGGPLADGMLVGEQVVCPMHAFRYEARSGACDQPGTCSVETFPVEVVGDAVRVGVPVA
ncbi:MAG: nitrite reductase (NAD(P)H) small subunit [Gemmataceae bacterium]|nr:nitrite reductase (NAD(P)H) small subunit [Gemmataceae bacterium]